jgi:hypothetical protein
LLSLSRELKLDEDLVNKVSYERYGYFFLFLFFFLLHDSFLIIQIWTAIVHALQLEHEKHLLYKRHIDQMMMCSIYGTCKAFDHYIKFMDIVLAYEKQPQCVPQVPDKTCDTSPVESMN